MEKIQPHGLSLVARVERVAVAAFLCLSKAADVPRWWSRSASWNAGRDGPGWGHTQATRCIVGDSARRRDFFPSKHQSISVQWREFTEVIFDQSFSIWFPLNPRRNQVLNKYFRNFHEIQLHRPSCGRYCMWVKSQWRPSAHPWCSPRHRICNKQKLKN